MFVNLNEIVNYILVLYDMYDRYIDYTYAEKT